MFDVLQFLVKKFKLESRVELLGFVDHNNVGSVLNRGHIFINTSITEAFCISALEAASAGLLVVTTNVGGTPEILPNDLMYLADPNIKSFYQAVCKAIKNYQSISPSENHERVMKYYNWKDISARIEKIYYDLIKEPEMTFLERLAGFKKVCKIALNLF